MNIPSGVGQPGSWTHQRFLTDLTFAGGLLVVAGLFAMSGQPAKSDTILARATASPTPHASPRLETARPFPINRETTRHNNAGGMRPHYDTPPLPFPRPSKPPVKTEPKPKTIQVRQPH